MNPKTKELVSSTAGVLAIVSATAVALGIVAKLFGLLPTHSTQDCATVNSLDMGPAAYLIFGALAYITFYLVWILNRRDS